MFQGLPHLSHFFSRKIRKKVIAVILAIPAAVLLIFMLDPLGFNRQLAGEPFQNSWVLPKYEERKTYAIHIWKHGKRLAKRFLRSYGKRKRDPYKWCSARNCILSTDDSRISEADAVMFHLHQTKGPFELPKHRSPHQMWVFFTDESPYHTFYASHKYTLPDYNGIFNWSMTYLRDSDVPVPYGRTMRLTPEEIAKVDELPNFAKLKPRTAAILGSNCGGTNHRWNYIRELKKYINVDVYGRCGNLTCPGHFAHDCTAINSYKFYLAFENSNCREYMTEKLWWNAFHKGAVPIVMGAPKEDYESLCPPNSFIHVDDFPSPLKLAHYINFLAHNDTAYNEYFLWKNSYKVLNEHGYFGSWSAHLCRICEKLNTKPFQPKSYEDLSEFLNSKRDCSKPKWTPKKYK